MLEWLGTLRARVGGTFGNTGNTPAYVTGGLSAADIEVSTPAVATGIPFGTDSDTSVGYYVGAGIEHALANGWNVKVEYLYHDLGDFGNNTGMVGGPPP